MSVSISEILIEDVSVHGLQNLCSTKCWLNVVLQAIKSCPIARKKILHAFSNIPFHYGKVQFYRSFLQDNIHHSKFKDSYPWADRESEFHEYGIVELNNRKIQDIETAIGKVGQDCRLPELCVSVTQHESSCSIQGSKYLLIHALKKEERYNQLQTPKNIYRNKLALEVVHYNSSVAECIQEEIDKGATFDCTNSEVFFVVVNTVVQKSQISFSPNMTETILNKIEEIGQGFQVISHIQSDSFIQLNDQTFVLTAMIEHVYKGRNQHFTILVNNALTQKWTRIDDAECEQITYAKDFVKSTLSCNNVIGFVYQKLPFVVSNSRGIPTFIPNSDVSRRCTRGNSSVPKRVTYTLSMDYWENLRPVLLPGGVSNKKVKKNSGDNDRPCSTNKKDSNAYMSKKDSKDVAPLTIIPPMEDLSLASHLMVLEGHHTETLSLLPKSMVPSQKESKGMAEIVVDQVKQHNMFHKIVQGRKSDLSVSDEDESIEDDSIPGFAEIKDVDEILGKKFYVLEGIDPVRGVVQKCFSDGKNVFYKVFFSVDNTWDMYRRADMLAYLLNTRNGTPFRSNGREYLLVAVHSHTLLGRFEAMKDPQPQHFQFNVRWGKDKFGWCPYNYTMFSAEPMAKYIREHLDFDCFKRHYDEELGKNPKKYRYMNSSKGNEEQIKWILGNGKTETVSIETAGEYFGAVGVENIRKQFHLMPSHVSRQTWFHADSGLPVEKGSGLVNVHEDSYRMDITNSTEQLNYTWIRIDDVNWIQCHVMKTNGVFCIIASLLNSSQFPQTRCAQIFDDFKSFHTSSGEIEVNWCFSKIQERVKDGPALYFEKCFPLKSFEELASLSHDRYNGKVLIVCYSTTHSTTHAICWDIGRKRILDSEYRNANIFSYNMFNSNDVVAYSIVEALSTTINVPCIFSIAYWKEKSKAKRKR